MRNRATEPMIEEFKDDPRIKFVSLCVDGHKKSWLESIAKGPYTHPNSINLYVAGHGIEISKRHPLLAKYNITSYPTVMIVRSGKLFSAEPPFPDPKDKKDIKIGNSRKFVEQVEETFTGIK